MFAHIGTLDAWVGMQYVSLNIPGSHGARKGKALNLLFGHMVVCEGGEGVMCILYFWIFQNLGVGKGTDFDL